MNASPFFAARGAETVGETEALALMLDYIVDEAERLGLHLCASHAESARDAIAYEKAQPVEYRL